jgi:hypothetical protein
LLRRFGIGHWCLTLDADEFLLFEGAPQRSLRQFCRDLDRRGKRVATGILLDLYSDQPVQETFYRDGQDPLQLCRFFDRDYPATVYPQGGAYRNQDIIFGGVRQRVFPTEHDYLLSKAVLLRYQPDVVINPGQHLTNIKAEYHAREEICLLHFKFFASFEAYALQEAERKVHALGAEQYSAYASKLKGEQSLVLYDPNHSVPFEGTAQLRQLGLLLPEESPSDPCLPAIEPVLVDVGERPFWSVMVSIFERVHNVDRVLSSVLRQADDTMQIEVVCDFSDAQLQASIASEVARVGKGRVAFHPLTQRVGHPHVLNHCIARARGRWVHVLHDDDWVKPGYYDALRSGIESGPEPGAIFCQHSIATRVGAEPSLWHSWTERESPGLIDDWLARIAVECRVQFSAMAVRRDVYETLGGFCPDARSGFDWDMWIRIACRYPVFYVPDPLVTVGRDETAESSRLVRNGEQILDGHAVLNLATRYLPPERAHRLSEQGRERLAVYALELARRYLQSGDNEAALANLRSAVHSRPSAQTIRRLIDVLQGEWHEFEG